MRVLSRKTKPSAVNKLKLYFIFWAFLIMVFSAIISIQIRKHTELSAEIYALNQQINDASVRQQSLQQQIDFNKSDEFVEKYAHDKLGLVHSNEVIIYDDNYKLDK